MLLKKLAVIMALLLCSQVAQAQVQSFKKARVDSLAAYLADKIRLLDGMELKDSTAFYFTAGPTDNIQFRVFPYYEVFQDSTAKHLLVQYFLPSYETNVLYETEVTGLEFNYANPTSSDTVFAGASFTAPANLPDSAIIAWTVSSGATFPADCFLGCVYCESFDPPKYRATLNFDWKLRLTGQGSPWTAMGDTSKSNVDSTESFSFMFQGEKTTNFSPSTALEIGISAGEIVPIGWRGYSFATCNFTLPATASAFSVYTPNFSWTIPEEWVTIGYFRPGDNPNTGDLILTGSLELSGGLTVPENVSVGGRLSVGETIKIAGGFPRIGRVLTATDTLGNTVWALPSSGGGSVDTAIAIPNPLYGITWFEDFFGNPTVPSTSTSLYKDWQLQSTGATTYATTDSTGFGNSIGTVTFRSNASNIVGRVHPYVASTSRGAFRLNDGYFFFQARFKRFTNSTSNDSVRVGLVSTDWMAATIAGPYPTHGVFFDHFENSGDSLYFVVKTADTTIATNTGVATGVGWRTVAFESEDGVTLAYVDGVLVAVVSQPLSNDLTNPVMFDKVPAVQFGFYLDYMWVKQDGIDRRW